MSYGCSMSAMRVCPRLRGAATRIGCALGVLLTALSTSACQEEGTIVVHSLTFRGVKAVDESRLRSALATRQSSKIPWGRKAYFDRTRFDTDLKRVQAFYTDRGYPDARVTGFDVKLNDKQDAVDASLTVDEGQPVTIVAVNLEGFDAVPPRRLGRLQRQLPIAVGQARNRQSVVAAHELTL